METIVVTILLGGIGFIVCGLVFIGLMHLWFWMDENESIQVMNAFTFARDKMKMHVNSASYLIDTFGDGSENINLKPISLKHKIKNFSCSKASCSVFHLARI